MFTEEEHATRALGAAFHHDHEFAVSWLRTIGLDVNSIVGVSVERPYVVPDPDGGERRADVYLEVTGLHGELGEGEETGANSEVVIIEAKIDALLDEEQLEHAGRVADRVVCLIPDELPQPNDAEIVTATWEGLIGQMEQAGQQPLPFLARQFAALVDSPRVRRRRRLAMIVENAEVPSGWSIDPADKSTSGNALGVIYGPSRGDHNVRIELANEQRGRDAEPYAYVLICSTLSTTDPIVIDALRRAELPSSDSVNVAYRSHSGRRSKDERNALDAAGVPRSRTYGYGRKQFENHGWSGYGCVVDLKSSEYSEAEAREWLTFAMKVAGAADDVLARALEEHEPVS